MNGIKALFNKYREIIMYLIFGALTTAVGWAVYFVVFWTWKEAFGIAPDVTGGSLYMTGYTVAQIVQWVAAVLFAFFTNRRWVFTEAGRDVSVWKQLPPFAGARLVTLFIDYIVTYLGTLALSAWFEVLTDVSIFGISLNLADLIAKLTAAVIVVVSNYIFSKFFVFKKSK